MQSFIVYKTTANKGNFGKKKRVDMEEDSDNRDFKIPGWLTSRTVMLGAEDRVKTDGLGIKLSTFRSGLFERRTAGNLKFLALLVNNGIF